MDEKVINIPEYPDCEMESVKVYTSPMYDKYEEENVRVCASPMCDKYEEYSVQEKNLNLSTNNIKYDIGENDWEEDITKTIIKWRDDIAKNSFIYGQLLDKKETYIQCVLIFTLILSIFMTILSGISVALSTLNVDINFQWVIFSFNIIMLISSGTITGLNGVIKIFSWDNQVKIFTKIIEKLDTQWFIFETELNIPSKQRQNAQDFIKRVDGEYMHLMQICPHIGVNDYVKANKSYQESLSNNLIWQHQFRKQIEAKLKK